MPTPHLVEQAANFLRDNLASPKEKLAIAGKFVWAATLVSDGWTPKLRERAKTACSFLFEHGHLEKTVKTMDEKDASRYLKQFTKDVTQLATDIEQARSEQPRRRKS
jgi:hypothetical protein